MEDLLDDESKDKKSLKLDWIQLLPPLIAISLFLYRLSFVLFKNYTVEIENVLSILVVVTSLFLFKSYRKVYFILLFVVFGAGAIGLTYHYPVQYSFSLNIFSFNPTQLSLLIFSFVLFRNNVLPRKKVKSHVIKKDINQERVQKFKEKLKDYSIEDLEEIVKSDNYQNEFKIAAKYLLNKKKDDEPLF